MIVTEFLIEEYLIEKFYAEVTLMNRIFLQSWFNRVISYYNFFFLIGKNWLLEKMFFCMYLLTTLYSPVTDIDTCWYSGGVLLFTFPLWRFLEMPKLKRSKKKGRQWLVTFGDALVSCLFWGLLFALGYFTSVVLRICEWVCEWIN